MSTELIPEPRMSLFQIETELGELMAYREGEELTPEEQATADGLIREYVQRELEKVDGIRAYLRHCEVMVGAAKEEVRRQNDRAKAWQGRYDRLKDTCRYVMDFLGKKRLEGRTGSLTIKGNGGRQPVTVTDSSMVPDVLCDFVGTIPGEVFVQIRRWANGDTGSHEVSVWLSVMKRTPRLSSIADELAQPCERCGGTGTMHQPPVDCAACGGSGHQGVPGARLEPRGSHLEVK